MKTDVETIANTNVPAAAPAVSAEEILARDYTLNIRHCLRRGWALVRKNFWPLVGVSAFVTVALAGASSSGFAISNGRFEGSTSILGILLAGPLLGGLFLYFLKRIRGEAASVETAFTGFRQPLPHLVLASFVVALLTVLGFLCLILPGIYLLVAWKFTYPLIVDKGLDFWTAMRVSRKVISKHWWNFFGLVIVCALINLAGLLALIVGILITSPITIAALMYAYEDIIGAVKSPSGDFSSIPRNAPTAPPIPPPDRFWRRFAVVLACVVLIPAAIAIVGLLTVIAIPNFVRARQHAQALHEQIEKQKPVLSPKNSGENSSANRPHVISVLPADGATNVDVKQELRIRFDQPMNPNDLEIQWLSGGFLPDAQPRYESARNEFVVSVRLTPGQTNELEINWNDGSTGGFRGTNFTPVKEYRWHFTTKPVLVKPGAVKPNVIQISPAPGETLPVLTLLEITFDQMMMPPDQGFPYLRTGSSFGPPALIPAFDYNPSSHRFTVPVVLPPDNDTKLTLEGFNSADGVASDPVSIRCQIGTNSYSSEQLNLIATAAKDSRLEELLSSMKAARARLNSGTETVQQTSFFGGKGSFSWITANSADFKWQGTNQIYADISEIMNTKAFILGNDGKTCWLYADGQDGRRLDSSPAALVPDIYTSVADPFTLTKVTVAEAIAKGRLVYQGQTQFDGRVCHRIQSWMVRQPQNEYDRVFAAKLEWWIDAKSFLPVQVVENSQYNSETFRFRYEKLNQPLPDAAFQPPATTGINAKQDAFRLFKQETPAPDEKRFLTIKDGCDGSMSGRLGWSGPSGTTSSGLN